ncbi:hypothetical protein Ddye_016296 [Dipteronia dyeriana]|uniref:DUF1664 domain-containing protein n=1 Tax=Dipteronia dyeriana TaxID=168575 RepID=A0AAD9U7D7_9ROSI|nr:hypothetical protein Ddye_016296 [Dipteronia dyeriana]
MALQASVSTSKVLILLGAGLTSSIVLRSGRLSEIISQLQELLKGVEEVEISPFKYDSSLLAAQIRQLSQEIKELTLSRPVTIYNGGSSSGGYASYLMPAAALGAVGYCYMWWKGLSFSDVMFVTKNNMANAVATVSKQLENVSEALASTKRHLSKRLENLDWKVEEQMETSKLIANDVSEMKSNLSEIGLDLDSIFQMVSGMEDKLQLLEGKQDVTNTGLLYLCQVAGGFKDAQNIKSFQEVGAKLSDHSSFTYEDKSLKGLQFLTETNESEVIDKSLISTKKSDLAGHLIRKVPTMKTKIHRSYPVGLSLAPDLI